MRFGLLCFLLSVVCIPLVVIGVSEVLSAWYLWSVFVLTTAQRMEGQ